MLYGNAKKNPASILRAAGVAIPSVERANKMRATRSAAKCSKVQQCASECGWSVVLIGTG